MDERDFEIAAAQEQHERERAIAAARRRPAARQERDGTGRIVCRGCGLPLSPERLAAKPDAARCVECEALFERTGLA